MAASFAIQIAELPPHMPDLFTKADKLISALDSEQAASSPFQADLFRLREVQGRFDEAGRIAQKALTVEPRNIVHLNNYAWAVAAYKNAGIMAMGKINQALRFGGPLENMIDSKAIALLSASQPAEAISTLEAMIVNSPDYPNSSFWLHLAKAHQTSGNQEKADLYRQNAGKKPFSLPFDQKIAKNN